ncbi:DUF4375 domain-containing protein [Heliobacterium undosum]|uniref:DUF4375 domain-containing protein n=1 Tax=Heliomicrobium undosum TaxID=121734 RepID=A0A845L2Q6_9FIRM|nr:DUF4375 domain-containing protein [Heliomicrobium undosum]MZP29124.1 DUF4375 domain-containing protein [Heliomicrobium undosum]
MKRVVTKEMMESNPYEKWNQFVHLLALEEYDDLTEIQRVAHLSFWYDSEVQNGGHMQYFLNRGISLANETAIALKKIGAQSQAIVFSKALRILMTEGIPEIKTVEEYVEEARDGKFDEVDFEYYDSEPSIVDFLREYLEKYEEEFIVFQDL